jgi:hypothetical protein
VSEPAGSEENCNRADINARMAAWAPAVPDVSALTPVPPAAWMTPISAGGASLALDGVTGALGALTLAGTPWADARSNHTLGAFVYKTYTDADYATQGSFCCWGVGGRQAGGQPNSTVSSPRTSWIRGGRAPIEPSAYAWAIICRRTPTMFPP